MLDSIDMPQSDRRTRLLDVLTPIVFCVVLLSLCVFTSLHRLFWLDEIFTYYLAADPSFSHMMGAMADWINTTPPLYFILIWNWSRIFGDSELAMRLFSCLGYCVGGVIFWALLKRVFGRWPALFVAFAVLIGSEILEFHNAEARFYGLFFAETSLAVYLFAAICERMKNGSQNLLPLLIANAIVQASLVTTHYFGLVYSAIFVAAFCICFRRDLRKLCCCCISTLAGWIAFFPCIPMFLHHLEMARPRNWIPRPTFLTLAVAYGGGNACYAIVAATFGFGFILYACRHRRETPFLYLQQSMKNAG